MNATVLLALLPLSFGAYSVYIPAGYLAHITPSLPPICNATGPLVVQGPAQINYVCYNNTTQALTVRGCGLNSPCLSSTASPKPASGGLLGAANSPWARPPTRC